MYDRRDVNMDVLCIEEVMMLGVCAVIGAQTFTKKSMNTVLTEIKGEIFPRIPSKFGGSRLNVPTHAQAMGAVGRDFQAPLNFIRPPDRHRRIKNNPHSSTGRLQTRSFLAAGQAGLVHI